jgi:hypothetical protein
MSLACFSATSPTAPTPAGTAPTPAGTAPTPAGTAPEDKPYDIEAVPTSPERRLTDLRRCKGCRAVYSGFEQCTGTDDCVGETEAVYEDELEAEAEEWEAEAEAREAEAAEAEAEAGFVHLSAPGVLPPGFRYSESRDKAVPEDMHSSSHSADKDYVDEKGNVIGEKRAFEALCPNTPPGSPKRARASGGGVFVPETPPREDLAEQVAALRARVRVLEASECIHKQVIASLKDCMAQLRRRIQ